MSKKLSKLERELKKISRNTGLGKQSGYNILQGLGQLQALVESYQNGNSDPKAQQQFKQLQSQLGLSNLDEESMSNILKILGDLNSQLETLIPTLAEKSDIDERSIFKHLRSFNLNSSQMKTHDLSKTVSKFLKKLS